MVLRNTNDKDSWESEANRIWIVTNDRFTAYVRVEKAVKIPPSGMVEVIGRVHGVHLNMPLTLRRPQESKIDWLAINVLGENQIVVLFENREEVEVKGPKIGFTISCQISLAPVIRRLCAIACFTIS